MNPEQLKLAIEGALFAVGKPLSIGQLSQLFDGESIDKQAIAQALEQLRGECENRGVELVEVGSGFRFQVKADLAPWVSRLWDEKPPRYSRAVLETLALIAYRQPITRGEIEEIRGVSVSSYIIKTLSEREWIRVVGHRDVPGKPALFGTTNVFLDYFNLGNLSDLPTLAEIRSIDSIERELDFGETLGPLAATDEGADVDDTREEVEVAGHEEAAAADVNVTVQPDTVEPAVPETRSSTAAPAEMAAQGDDETDDTDDDPLNAVASNP